MVPLSFAWRDRRAAGMTLKMSFRRGRETDQHKDTFHRTSIGAKSHGGAQEPPAQTGGAKQEYVLRVSIADTDVHTLKNKAKLK